MFNKTNSSSANASAAADTPSSKKPNPTRSATVPSILGSDLIITGDIKTDGDIQIDGRLDGNLNAGNVTIGEQGVVNGKIISKSLHVRGKVTGKVNATSVELADTANVQADLTQDQLMIANGAFFDGKCTRKSAVPGGAAKKPA